MASPVILKEPGEVGFYREKILRNLSATVEAVRTMMEQEDPLRIFHRFKFLNDSTTMFCPNFLAILDAFIRIERIIGVIS